MGINFSDYKGLEIFEHPEIKKELEELKHKNNSMTNDEAINYFQSNILPTGLSPKDNEYGGTVLDRFHRKTSYLLDRTEEKLNNLLDKEPPVDSPVYDKWEKKQDELDDLICKYEKDLEALNILLKK